jgi:hypothetical protein
MSAPTRFPGGVTNVAKTTNTGNYGLPDPSSWHSYFDDFDYYTAGNWTVTNAATGTIALTDADGGVLLVTNNTGATDSITLQKVGASFLLEAGKPALFKARVKASDATQCTLVLGLCITDTTPIDATDGIFFTKADDVTAITALCRKNATTGSTSLAAGTLTTDFITLGWYYDGKSTVTVYVNDVSVGSMDGSSSFLPDTELTPTIFFANGSAGAKNLQVDYLLAAKKR